MLSFPEIPKLRISNNEIDSLFDNPEPYKDIMRKLFKSNGGLSGDELQGMLHASRRGALTERLEDLFFSGYIAQCRNEKGQTIYKVIDEFCLFYLRWVDPHGNADFDEDHWLYQSSKPVYHEWAEQYLA